VAIRQLTRTQRLLASEDGARPVEPVGPRDLPGSALRWVTGADGHELAAALARDGGDGHAAPLEP
jgi:hypothetical protein